MIQAVLGLTLLLALVSGAGGLYIKALRAEAKTMAQAYTIAADRAIENKRSLDAEIANAKKLEAALIEREGRYAELANGNRMLNRAIDALRRDREEVRAWADAPVPGDVVRLLLEPAAATGEGSGAPVPASAPDTGDAGAGRPDSRQR